jgi:hypothetical protein
MVLAMCVNWTVPPKVVRKRDRFRSAKSECGGPSILQEKVRRAGRSQSSTPRLTEKFVELGRLSIFDGKVRFARKVSLASRRKSSSNWGGLPTSADKKVRCVKLGRSPEPRRKSSLNRRGVSRLSTLDGKFVGQKGLDAGRKGSRR